MSAAATASTGRPRKAPALKLVEGTVRPDDAPAPPPLTRGEPRKPELLSEDASEMWDLVIEQMRGKGLLKPLDAGSLEMLCECYARWREAVNQRHARGITSVNSQGVGVGPWVGVEERAAKEFRGWCAEYGLTPAAETNLLGSDEATDDNPFA